MDALKIDKAAFVGWSDGGEIALKLAINHPDRVAKLFVFGANYNSEGSKPRRNGPSPTFTAYAVKCKRRLPEDVEDAEAVRRRSSTGCCRSGATRWASRRISCAAIQVPTMIADGDHDEVIRWRRSRRCRS